MTNTIPFRTILTESLSDPEQAQAYLDVALSDYAEDGDLPFFLEALRHVAEAQGGMSQLADKTNLNRPNLYKALAKDGNPKIQTLIAILRNFNLRLSVRRLES
jgi:probable addiction module antidote protein